MAFTNKKKILKPYLKPLPGPQWRGQLKNEAVKRVLIIQTAFLGDLILSTALFAAFKQTFPQSRLDVLVIPQTASVLQGNPHIDRLFVFDKRDRNKKKSEFRRLSRELREQGYDLVITPHRSTTTALLVHKAKIPKRIGYDRGIGAFFFYNVRVRFRRGIHDVERQLDLLRPLLPPHAPNSLTQAESTTDVLAQGADNYRASAQDPTAKDPLWPRQGLFPLPWQTELYPDKENHAKAEQLLQAFQQSFEEGDNKRTPRHSPNHAGPSNQEISPDKAVTKIVAIAPGSVWFTKKWPEEYFSQLVQLLRVHGYPVLLIGGGEDQELCERIAKDQKMVLNSAGRAGLLDSAALISRAALLITNDSAPLHMADAVNTPVLAIFGATSPIFGFAPYRSHDAVIGHQDLYCRPCRAHGSHSCPEGHFRCMLEIRPETVGARAMAMMEGG